MRSLSVLLLNALERQPWVSDRAWWLAYDADHAWRRRVYASGRGGNLLADLKPAVTLHAVVYANRLRRTLHVATDPACNQALQPRSRWLDTRSRGMACVRCRDERDARELTAPLTSDSTEE